MLSNLMWIFFQEPVSRLTEIDVLHVKKEEPTAGDAAVSNGVQPSSNTEVVVNDVTDETASLSQQPQMSSNATTTTAVRIDGVKPTDPQSSTNESKPVETNITSNPTAKHKKTKSHVSHFRLKSNIQFLFLQKLFFVGNFYGKN